MKKPGEDKNKMTEISESGAIKVLAMVKGGYKTERIASHLLTLRFMPLWNRIHKDVCGVFEEVYKIPSTQEEKDGKSNS